jgi:glc operon protein GlcG
MLEPMKTLPRFAVYAFSTLMAVLPSIAAQSLADKKALTLDTAKKMAEAAEKAAIANKLSVVIAVMDDGGNLLFLERMDEAGIGSVQIAQEKARTAVIFKSPSKDFQDGLAKGNLSYLKLDALPFEGGIPIVVGGKTIGAIGVSGGTAAQDGQVARAGVDWLTANLK